MLTMLSNAHVRTKQFNRVQSLFSAKYNFYKLNLMYICTTRYLCNVILQIVLQMTCGFSLFPHFQITL